MNKEGLESYIIRGGKEGRDRLAVLARVLQPTTAQFLDRIGSIEGALAVDAACGGGDVTFDLAGRVGPHGEVIGLDLDETKLSLARSEARERGIGNAWFQNADVTEPWPVSHVAVVYARFILTHLPDPSLMLRRVKDVLKAGGLILIEDIDFGGYFWDPECRALARSNELYIEAARRRGADPFIGRRLARLLDDGGFNDIQTSLIQPYGRDCDAKRIASLTFTATSGGFVADGLATEAEVDALAREIDEFTNRRDTTVSMPRIFQASARAP